MTRTRPLRVLTWHVHGSYLYYLSQVPHEFYLPVKPGHPEGYGGRLEGFDWPENVYELPAGQVKDHSFDCVLFQSKKNYLKDQYEILSEHQRQLPRIFLEHDPPRKHPTNTSHVVDDPEVLVVHVTPFNALMWDSGSSPTRVIDHGVQLPEPVHYTGEKARGVVVVNGLGSRGRRLGLDVFEQVRQEVPLDLIGLSSKELGGLGEISHRELPRFISQYRFFFNPIRYTSLGLAVCEAMMTGLPVVGLATTEMSTAVENGRSGYVDTDVNKLVRHMQHLLKNPTEAKRLSRGARAQAQERFSIDRFVQDWNNTLALVTGWKTNGADQATSTSTESTAQAQ